jgi:hypothetical protein
METASSPFFRIPTELRSIIYKYALTEDKPLSLKKPRDHAIYSALWPRLGYRHHLQILTTDSSHPHGVRKIPEANQLRFVNKQMYRETRGLSLRYNDLIFSTVEDADYFFEHCATAHLTKLRLVNIRWLDQSTLGLPNAEIWKSTSRFCGLYPHVTVHVNASNRSPNRPHTLLWLARYETHVRGTRHVLDALIEENSMSRDAMRPHLPPEPGAPMVHDNVRFFPAAEVFDEEEFKRTADDLDSVAVFSEVLGSVGVRGGLDGLVSLMKRLVEHGA